MTDSSGRKGLGKLPQESMLMMEGSLWIQVERVAFQAEGNTCHFRNTNYDQAEESVKEITTSLPLHFTNFGRAKS